MSTEAETVTEILARYREAYDKREGGILAFLDDEGDLKEGKTYAAYDEHRTDVWEDSHGDLSSLLSELEDALGGGLKVGDRVTVSADAETASGGDVFFDGEVAGEVIAPVDRDGDIEVRADDGVTQYVAPRFVKLAKN